MNIVHVTVNVEVWWNSVVIFEVLHRIVLSKMNSTLRIRKVQLNFVRILFEQADDKIVKEVD